jgi:hypothetical protein
MKRPTTRLSWLLATVPFFCGGCQSDVLTNKEEVRRIAEAYDTYMHQLDLAQQEFASENPMPQRLDFGVHGTLLLREGEVTGRPGFEVLRLRYTFLNETGISIDRAQVSLILTDPRTGFERSETQLLELPFRLAMAHGSSYTSFFDMPLEGLHQREGWSWRLDLQSERKGPPGLGGNQSGQTSTRS